VFLDSQSQESYLTEQEELDSDRVRKIQPQITKIGVPDHTAVCTISDSQLDGTHQQKDAK
jgi:hypothetical protein